ncbi:MAG TPA: phosphatase PAP2 family protein [Dehalococcoidia bacterium]|nr:phosphatase PAP2 family protein [Dehalococcoidia bacterium]
MALTKRLRSWQLARRIGFEALVVVGAYLAYQAVRRLIEGSAATAFDRALDVIALERRLGLFWEAPLQGAILQHHWLVSLFNWIYVWGYLPVIAAAALWLFVWHRQRYSRYRNAFLLSGACGLLFFALMPVAPPRMFPHLGFVDTVRLHSEVYRTFERPGFVNEFAAVPSFHFGWILLVGVALWAHGRWMPVRLAGVALPVAMLAAIVLTANHYFLDAAVGGALTLGALAVVVWVERLDPLSRLRRTALPLRVTTRPEPQR